VEKLAKIVDETYSGGRETPGLTAWDMREWLNKLIAKKQLKTFVVKIDKRIVEKDDEDERVIRIKKGATLEPVDAIKYEQGYVIEDPKTGTRYLVEIKSRGGQFFDEGTSQNTYHDLILEKIAEDFNLRKIKEGGLTRKLSVPKESIIARCSVHYTQEEISPAHEGDYVESWHVSLTAEDEQDKLFEQTCGFIKERAGPKSRND